MARPLSNDLRERVVAAAAAGESCRSVAQRFGVAVSSVVKWSQRQRMTGSVAPGKMGGHRKPVLDPHRDFIVQRIEDVPHLTLHRLKDELALRGVKVSHDTIWTFMRRHGLRFKKKRMARPVCKCFFRLHHDQSASNVSGLGLLSPAKMEIRASQSS